MPLSLNMNQFPGEAWVGLKISFTPGFNGINILDSAIIPNSAILGGVILAVRAKSVPAAVAGGSARLEIAD
ncbi:MAG TPA: hypothetical protein VGN86_18635 [Pyrinomonadaceae bacterium]|nr:hypothetical protein [Pyrinomonadaceae bacterium]